MASTKPRMGEHSWHEINRRIAVMVASQLILSACACRLTFLHGLSSPLYRASFSRDSQRDWTSLPPVLRAAITINISLTCGASGDFHPDRRPHQTPVAYAGRCLLPDQMSPNFRRGRLVSTN